MSSARSLETITANFMIFAADSYGDRKSTDEHYADYFESSYEDYLAMCKRLASECDFSQEEAIQIIVLEIVRQSEEMKAEVVAGKRQDSPFLKPLEKDNCWGKAVIALAEAFEVKLEQLAA